MQEELKRKKNMIKMKFLNFEKKLYINLDDVQVNGFEDVSIEALLGMGEGLVKMLMNRLNDPDRPDKEEIENTIKRLSAILKVVEEKDKPKSRAEMAADKSH